MKYSAALIVSILFCMYGHTQKTDKRLERQLNQLIEGFKGDIGIYVHDLKRNRIASIHADTVFPTASMIKVPIMTAVMRKIQQKELDYQQTLIYKDSLLYEGADIIGSFKNNEKIELGKVMMLMLTMSDNTASLWLQSLAGTGTVINGLMDSLGLKDTRVNSRTPGREANRKQYGWGQTTPREMSMLMEKIVKKEVIDEATDERMLKLLSRNFWDQEAISQIPAGVFIASKSGAVDASRNELLFVNGKNCSYIFCICTKNNEDKSWNASNEAWVLTKKISRLLWGYYN